MENSRTGQVHDYTKKRGVTKSAAFFPLGVDCSWVDGMDNSWDEKRSETLWNAAEIAEKRRNACLGRELVLALPSELTAQERMNLAADMAQHIADRYAVAVDAAIHAPSRHGDDRNFHVHMLVSSRRITPTGFGEKTRELDDLKRRGAEVEHIRTEWARLANRALEQAGQHVQIDHRSLQRQGINRMPSRHLGASATALERRGIPTQLGDKNRSAARLNGLMSQLEAKLAACVSLKEEADRAAQEVRQMPQKTVDDPPRPVSTAARPEETVVYIRPDLRPEAERPTPQMATEAPQGAVSKPSLVERTDAGPGSLHGAEDRREGTAAAVRPEAARPEPQKGAEAPQRAMSSPSLEERAGAGLGSLHGAEERREASAAGFRPEAARPEPQRAAEAPQRAVSSPSPEELFKRYVYAVQAERVRVTCMRISKDGEKRAFILDKRNGETRGFSPREALARMDEMRRIQSHGENIYYTPLSQDRHHILIDDMSAQSVNKLRADGFQPAVILSSSPGKFQCILTIPKLGTAFDNQVGERIAGLLNRRYGDKDFSGGIHPHRAPGFENRKPKHRCEDGGYPEVKLIAATRVECPKALELSQLFNSRLEEADSEARERAAAKEQERAQAAQRREEQRENREKDTPASPKPSPPAPRPRMR